MREVIPKLLWIGNAADARDVSGVLGTGISAVVDLAMEEPPIHFPREVVYCRIPLIDGSGNSPSILRAAIDTTASLIKSKLPTLVACGAGMSRSPTIVAAAMATIEQLPLKDALQRVTAGQPHDVSTSLLEKIAEVCKDVRGNHPCRSSHWATWWVASRSAISDWPQSDS